MSSSAPALATRARVRGLARVPSSPMARFVGRRVLTAIPVLWGVTILSFLVINLMPGNAASALIGPTSSPEDVKRLTHELDLDHPFLTRYWNWLTGILHGSFGHSIASNQSVGTILGQRLPVTFELLGYAFLISLAFAIPVAMLAARRPNGIADRVTMFVSMAGLSTPAYVLALVLVLVFAVKLGWLPAIGFVHLSDSVTGNIRSLTLPAVAIGFGLFCVYTRLLRADILTQMQSQDYVVTARAKGLSPGQVLRRHAFRNSLFGLVTLVGLNFGTLVGVTVIIEPIFSLPGIGGELITAVNTRDVPIIEATVVVFGLAVVVAGLLTDVLYAIIDPRIRYGRASA